MATRTLALIRGPLLDLLADEDLGRVTAAVQAGTWQPALSTRHSWPKRSALCVPPGPR
jgi:hypothetical protein